MEDKTIDEVKRFWDNIIRNPDGTINEEQLYKELADFSFVMDQVSDVYCHITGNLLSKCNYRANMVKDKADEYYNDYYREIAEDLIDDLISDEYIDKKYLPAILKSLKGYF